MSRWEPVIGLEVHAQLLTRTKLFCSCATDFGAPANVHTCPVCLGMPGALPVVNRRAVALAVRVALALDCEVQPASEWSRKSYFYPDLAKGYQISQYDRPLAKGGELRFELDGVERAVRLRRVHVEEDAAKSVHDAGPRSLVDFNRGGTPLVEIVSEPDLRSAAEAGAFLRELRQVLRYIGACDGNLEQGSLRCDANVSVRPVGASTFGARTELKNLNSFRFVQQAIEHELGRQAEVLARGGEVAPETRLWDAQRKLTRPMRGKEEAHDYRYFPEPDLPALRLDPALVEAERRGLPELPRARRARYVRELGLSDHDARVLTEEAAVARFFERALGVHGAAKSVANWVINEVLHDAKERGPASPRLSDEAAAQVGELVALVDEGAISGTAARRVYAALTPGMSPRRYVEEQGLRQLSDPASLEPLVERVLAAHPESVAKYKAGKTGMLAFFVGQVMKASDGQASPRLVSALVARKLAD